jgi:two-component system sensor histidine kinase KdpD
MTSATRDMPTRRGRSGLAEYLRTMVLMAAVTAGCFALRSHLAAVDVAMLLLLGVVAVAARYRRGPALLASVLSIAAFDFLFVPPYYTFDVHDTAYLLTFVVMLVVALTMSRLTGMIREHALEAEMRGRRATAVAALNADLAGAATHAEVFATLVGHVNRVVPGQACTLSAEELDSGSGTWSPAVRELLARVPESVAARWVHEGGRTAGPGTTRCPESEALLVAIRTRGRGLGLVAVRPEPTDRVPEPEDVEMVEALAAQAALALERTLLAEQHAEARADAEAERLRTSLLSSLSHDLRTPLATIEGAASSLLDVGGGLAAEGRHDLADTILQESRRMTRLVSNLLNMVRVETGALAVQKSWQPLEETLGVALLRVEERLKDRPVEVDLPPDLPLVPIDELLIEQVFINLLENAAKYTLPGTQIDVTASHANSEVRVEVADRGPGVPPGAEEAVFRKFYRAQTSQGVAPSGGSSPGGAGLGLTISRGIITAHGGRMWVEQRPGGGAAFRFTVPLSGPHIPALPAEQDTVG